LIFIVINKIDILKRDQLDEATATELDELISSTGVEILELSCMNFPNASSLPHAAMKARLSTRLEFDGCMLAAL
jgi:nucleolar GTP-binding protein